MKGRGLSLALMHRSTREVKITNYLGQDAALIEITTMRHRLAFGPHCGKDFLGINVDLSLDIVPPGAPGLGVSVDVGSIGVGAGVGPEAGAGLFVGLDLFLATVIKCAKYAMRLPEINTSSFKGRRLALIFLFGGFVAFLVTAILFPKYPKLPVIFWGVSLFGAVLYAYILVKGARTPPHNDQGIGRGR